MNRNYFIRPLIYGICLLFTLTAQAQWKQDRFIIGTFYDPKLPNGNMKDTAIYAQKLQGVKDAYFNLLTGMDHNYDPAFIDYKLKLINRLGLKTLLMNEASWGKGNTTFNNAKAAQWLDYTTKLDKDRSNALYGYFIFDEPLIPRQKDIKNWVSYVKGRDKNRLAYINLLPAYLFKTHEEYEKYLDTFLSGNDSGKFDVISYDFYPFLKDGILPEYFYNLDILKQKANGRPIWCFALTTKHREHPEIGPYELNFMVFAPLTYGVKGMLYFTYETIVGSSVEFGKALVDPNNAPTTKYYQVKNINRFLSKVAGPIIMNSANVGTYHVSEEPYTNQSLQPDDMLNKNTPVVNKIDNENMMVGIFKSNNGEYNLLLFNKSSDRLRQVAITLKGNYQNKTSLSVPYTQYKESTTNAFQSLSGTYDSANDLTRVVVSFDAGEGRILKLKP